MSAEKARAWGRLAAATATLGAAWAEFKLALDAYRATHNQEPSS